MEITIDTTRKELAVSALENLRHKTAGICEGLGRAIVGEEYKYRIFEEKMPTNESLREYFLARADYLKDLYKKEHDFERQRQLESAEDRTRLAYETLNKNVNRPDLVVEGIVGLQKMCEKYEVFPEAKTGTEQLMEAQGEYFKRMAEIVANRLNTPMVKDVRGAIDSEIYPVDFVGILKHLSKDEV